MNAPQKISESVIAENPYLQIKEKVFVDEHGRQWSFLISAINKTESRSTLVVPITDDGELLYTREYRYWPEEWIVGFPVGILEDGLSEAENCQKELSEETGYTSEKIEHLGRGIYGNYFEGFTSYYVATWCRKVSDSSHEHTEKIEVHKTSVRAFEDMFLHGELVCPRSWQAFSLAKERGYFDTKALQKNRHSREGGNPLSASHANSSRHTLPLDLMRH